MEFSPESRSEVQIRYVSTYSKQADRLLNPAERAEMEDDIACKADLYPVVPETGGWRKARWAIRGKGKSGGVRVIYYFVSSPGIVFFADIYAKGKKDNLTADDKKVLRRLAFAIKGGLH